MGKHAEMYPMAAALFAGGANALKVDRVRFSNMRHQTFFSNAVEASFGEVGSDDFKGIRTDDASCAGSMFDVTLKQDRDRSQVERDAECFFKLLTNPNSYLIR